MNRIITRAVLAMAAVALLAGPAMAERGATYDVSITNLTRAQIFTPFLVASHRADVALFVPGDAPSAELAALAEGGDTGPLAALLSANPDVGQVTGSAGLLFPGETVTVTVAGGDGYRYLSLAAMLIPTNDGFVALRSVRLPATPDTRTVAAVAYDAGSEPNDELCASIPGPDCGGAGGSPGIGGEGHVHVHSGIHGVGDLDPATFDWRNPVAEIRIVRVHDDG